MGNFGVGTRDVDRKPRSLPRRLLAVAPRRPAAPERAFAPVPAETKRVAPEPPAVHPAPSAPEPDGPPAPVHAVVRSWATARLAPAPAQHVAPSYPPIVRRWPDLPASEDPDMDDRPGEVRMHGLTHAERLRREHESGW